MLAEKVVRMSDIILEILDSRFIKETRNPELEKQIKKENKKISEEDKTVRFIIKD